jgi:serine/threonine protein kinase
MTDTTLAGRYHILKPLGSGGFGNTFLAEDLFLPGHPRCVVKQLQPQSTNAQVMEVARRLFNREAEVLYQLGSSVSRIPRLLAHFEQDKDFYLVQEFIEGHDLSHELTPGKKYPESWVKQLLLDVLSVLSEVHQRNIIHRDIKPANLMRRQSDQRIVLIDFGAVKEVGSLIADSKGETAIGTQIGTRGYMPIEQFRGQPRLSSDVYAVGVVAIQALTGLPPSQMEDYDTGELHWQRYVQVSPGFQAVLEKMVHPDWRQRYPSAVEALQAVQALTTAATDQATQPLSPAVAPTVALTEPVSPSWQQMTPTAPRRTGVPCVVWLFGGLGTLGLAFIGLILLVGLLVTEETPVTEASPSPNPTEPSQPSGPASPGGVDRYGAIAYNRWDGSYGYSYNFSTQEEAEARAIQECERVSQEKICEVLVWFRNGCGALARDGRNNAGSGWGETKAVAQREAIASCRSIGGSDCAVVETVCTD